MWLRFLLLFLITTPSFGQTKLAVIDTGLDLNDPRFKSVLCKSGHKDFTGSGIKDTVEHGTHVTGLIKQYAKNADYCILIYKFYQPDELNAAREILAIKEAIKAKVDIINISGGGEEYSKEEYELIKNNPKVLFVVAAGNNGENLDIENNKYYPASHKLPNILAIGGLNEDGTRGSYSNYGTFVIWERGTDVLSTIPNGRMGIKSGSSMATAIKTGKILHYHLIREILGMR